MTALGVVTIFLLLAVLGLCWAAYQMMLQQGRLQLRVENLEQILQERNEFTQTPELAGLTGLTPGSALRDFELPLASGGSVTLSEWRGRRVVLAFVSPRCNFSLEFLSSLPAATPAGGPGLLLVSTGDLEENRELTHRYRLSYPLAVQENSEVSSLFRAHGTPTGYLVDAAGKTEGALLIGKAQLLEAIGASPGAGAPAPKGHFSKSVEGSKLVRNGLRPGTKAPEFTLPLVNEGELSLRELFGRRTLLVFSDPGCAPCQELAPKLERIHRRMRRLQVLMVSRGDREANRAKVREHGLSFPVVLQKHWEISRAYGIFATPVGYLIGADGVLAFDVAVGEEAILRLAEL